MRCVQKAKVETLTPDMWCMQWMNLWLCVCANEWANGRVNARVHSAKCERRCAGWFVVSVVFIQVGHKLAVHTSAECSEKKKPLKIPLASIHRVAINWTKVSAVRRRSDNIYKGRQSAEQANQPSERGREQQPSLRVNNAVIVAIWHQYENAANDRWHTTGMAIVCACCAWRCWW